MKQILEKSGNFVRGKKWEPCHSFSMSLFFVLNNNKFQQLANKEEISDLISSGQMK